MENREIGTVKWFNNHFRYGFIKREHGDAVFFNDPDSKLGTLNEEQKVEFTIDKLEISASNVGIVGECVPVPESTSNDEKEFYKQLRKWEIAKELSARFLAKAKKIAARFLALEIE